MKNYNNFISSNEYSIYNIDELELIVTMIFTQINKLDESIKKDIYYNWNIINEGIFDKVKNIANNYRQKLFKIGETLKDESKKAWDSIKKNVKRAITMMKSVIEKIKDDLKKIRNYCDNKLEKLLTNSKTFVEKTKELDWTNLDNEIKSLYDFTKWVSNNFYNNIIISIKNSMIGLFTKKDEHVVLESFIFENDEQEGISSPLDLFRKMIGFIDKIPPFSWLHSIAENSTKLIEKSIEILNNMVKSFGGPALIIPTITSLIGIAVEIGIHSLTEAGILYLAPGVGEILHGLAIVAIFISSIHAMNHIIDGKILGQH